MAPPLIELENVVKTYPAASGDFVALQSINLTIDPQEFIAIIGPSGSGKSTLMNLLGLLDSDMSGSYRFENQNIAALNPDQRAQLRNTRIGFVFQNYSLLARQSAIANVELPLLYNNTNKKTRKKMAQSALESVGLAGKLERLPSQLSGGEQQRVAIARALVNQPSLILADEPTGSLDSQTGSEIIALFRQLHEKGHCILLITHDDNIANNADRRIAMHDGRLVKSDTRKSAAAV